MSDRLLLTNTGKGFGKLTLGVLPVCSEVPVSDNDLVNKKYVDDSVGTIDVTNSAFTEPILQVLSDTNGRLTNNTVLGKYALLNYNSTSVGVDNTAVGNEALKSNTTGASNTGVSANALQFNTSGYSNTAVGYNSMPYNTSGFNNTAIGYNSLPNAQDGRYNTAVGVNSMRSMSSNSQYNVAIGYDAGYSSTWGNDSYGITLLGAGTSINGVYQYSTAVGSTAQIKKSNQIVLGTASEVVTIPGFTTAGVVHNLANGDLTSSLIVAADITNATITSAKLASSLDLSGNPTAPTQDASNNSTRIATTAFVTKAVSDASNNVSISGLTITNNKTSLGTDALKNNSSGIENTATGFEALKANTSGNRNTSFGYGSLKANTTGSNNIALGANVLTLNTTGTGNIAIGCNALIISSDKSKNIAIGNNSLSNNNNDGNVAIGDDCLFNNTDGYSNVAVGRNTMRANTEGGNGVAVGASALQNNTIGQGNTALGNNSLFNNTTGNLNVALGFQSLYENTNGNDNTAIGHKSGYTAKKSTNINNTYIGSNSDIDSSASSWSTSTAIGYNSKITASNQITLGTISETVRIPKLNSVGVVHNDANGDLSTSQIVAADITNATITSDKLASSLDLSGNPTAPTQDASNNSTRIATTAFVKEQNYITSSSLGVMPTTAPVSPVNGSFYFASGELKIYDGSNWLTFSPLA